VFRIHRVLAIIPKEVAETVEAVAVAATVAADPASDRSVNTDGLLVALRAVPRVAG
jgi:hypothetical protein